MSALELHNHVQFLHYSFSANICFMSTRMNLISNKRNQYHDHCLMLPEKTFKGFHCTNLAVIKWYTL